jgi:F0F1-type ATP synthase delta subunit
MQPDLSNFFTTKSQATDFTSRLSAISEKIFQTDFNLEKELLNQFGIQKRDKFLILLKDNNISLENSALQNFLSLLQQTVSQLPLLTLTIAFQPKEETLKLLADWFPLNLKQQILLDITVDPSLIAGAILSYNGKHQDYSIKPTVEKIITDKLDEQIKNS